MKLSMIVAMDRDGLIGKDNGLPWNHPEDLKFFRKMTTGKTIIMGRKTFDSIGKALPNRKNIVISSKFVEAENVATAASWEDAIKLADMVDPDGEVFIIGGKSLYEKLIDEVDDIYVTIIDKTYKGDTHLEHELFQKLKKVHLHPTNPVLKMYGHERIYLSYPDEVTMSGMRTEAWMVTVLEQVTSNDVMLNFVKLTRCM